MLVLVNVISINSAFGQSMGAVDSKGETEHSPVIIIPSLGSGAPGCEETIDGCYIPAKANVSVGEKIIFSNTDTVAHTFTADSMENGTSRAFDSGLVIAGNSYEWIPTTEGEFPYHCTVHPWMNGIIHVEVIHTLNDIDNDGIDDKTDQCPTQAETVNGFQDEDGCPDISPPTDIDNDGIDDKTDQCPTQAETINGSNDSDGCPDVVTLQDSDKDGIVDSADTCPRSPETFNGYEDEDGCPDNSPVTDSDEDLIIDTLDSCPTQSETINGFQDEDGCPDIIPPTDIDNDGIDDKTDQCPTQAETVNEFQDSDGCPDKLTSIDSDKDEPVLMYVAIGIGIAGAGTAIGIKLHGKGTGGKDTQKVESDNHGDQDTSIHVEVRITGGIEE